MGSRRPHCIRLLFSLAFVCATAAVPAFGRTWTDRAGKTLEAELVKVYNGYVVLQAGTDIKTIPIAMLSDVDRIFVRQHVTGEESTSAPTEPATTPPPTEIPLRPEYLLFGQDVVERMATESAERLEAAPSLRHRAWTDTRGNQILGFYAGVEPPKVRIRNAEGQLVTYPLAAFDAVDLQYVAEEDPSALDFAASLSYSAPGAAAEETPAEPSPLAAAGANDNPASATPASEAAGDETAGDETAGDETAAATSPARPAETPETPPAAASAEATPPPPAPTPPSPKPKPAPPTDDDDDGGKTFAVKKDPFWETWWFRGLILLGILTGCGFVFFREQLLMFLHNLMSRFGGGSRY